LNKKWNKEKSRIPCDCKYKMSKMSSNLCNGFNFLKQGLVTEKDSYSEYK